MGLINTAMGGFLVVLGALAYVASEQGANALIPTVFGATLLFFGALAERDGWRNPATLGSAVVAALGAFAALGRALPSIARANLGTATMVQLTMGVLLVVFARLCMRELQSQS